MNIVLIVTGGVAAYKACDIIGLAKRGGHNTRVIMTECACEFVTPLLLATLSENPVHTGQFSPRTDVEHIALAKWADVILVAPATYNFIGKIANGIADDLASTVTAAIPAGKHLFIAPAMNTEMWNKPALKRNLRNLKEDWGDLVTIVAPRKARLACGDEGEGALARPADIIAALGQV